MPTLISILLFLSTNTCFLLEFFREHIAIAKKKKKICNSQSNLWLNIFTECSGERDVLGSLIRNFWKCFWKKVFFPTSLFSLFPTWNVEVMARTLKEFVLFCFSKVFYPEVEKPCARIVEMNIRSWGSLTHSRLFLIFLYLREK